MDPFSIATLGGVALFAGYSLWSARRGRRKLRRSLLAVPRTRVNDATDGEVRIHGRVRLPESAQPLVAPLSGRECVAWRLSIEHRSRRHDGRQVWRRVAERSQSRAFVVDDGDGQAFVDDVTLWDIPESSLGGAGYWYEPSSDRMRELLASLDLPVRGVGWQRDVRIQEGVCAVGDPIVVVGHGRWEVDAHRVARGYRDAGQILRLLPAEAGLVATTDPRVLRATRP